MKNWKTTTVGVLTAACYLGYKLFSQSPITGEDITLAIGMVGLGAFSKDHNVTGGEIKQ